MIIRHPTHLSDEELLAETKRLASCERHATTSLIASLMELDARRLYLGEGYSSLFTYCTQVLHLSEHAAYGRIEAARAARRFPAILELLADGSLTLTAICLLRPVLTSENHTEALEAARHRSKREVEHIVVRLRPQPDVAPSVRKLPDAQQRNQPSTNSPEACEAPLSAVTPTSGSQASLPVRPAIVRPLAPERYKIQLTVGRETYCKLRQVQDLLRHAIPDGDPAAIFERALTLLLANLQKTKLAATERPGAKGRSTPKSRHVPASVRREVWARDGARCAFTGTNGRCMETGFLEFHHVVPYADGGKTTADNLELRCRAHNVYEAERYFGPNLFDEEVDERLSELGPGPSHDVVKC